MGNYPPVYMTSSKNDSNFKSDCHENLESPISLSHKEQKHFTGIEHQSGLKNTLTGEENIEFGHLTGLQDDTYPK
jgi:ABC-type transport system involved in cytochrome c biogenesis ATPase subunit